MNPIKGWESLDWKRINSILDSIPDDECVPSKDKVMRCLEYSQGPHDVKVVILGQDPYPDPEQADGLAFSSKNGKVPKSLANIHKEIINDVYVGIKCHMPTDLEHWAKQGVLLLNTTLTTQPYISMSHKETGYGLS